MERHLVTITHPSDVQFNVNLSTYELNRAQTDPDFLAELLNKYYSLYKKGLIFGAGEEDHDSANSGPSNSKITTLSDMEEVLSEDSFSNSEPQLEKVNHDNHKLWSNEATLLLINLVKKYYEDLDRGIKKYVWRKISNEIVQEINKTFTITQIETKWKGLVKHYKDLTRFNNTSGNSRKQWKYYNIINEILYEKPEINPVAICDSHNGLTIKTKDGMVLSTKVNDIPDQNENDDEFESTFSKKRKTRECGVSKRHAEKMQRLDNLQGTLDRMVNIMAAKFAKEYSD